MKCRSIKDNYFPESHQHKHGVNAIYLSFPGLSIEKEKVENKVRQVFIPMLMGHSETLHMSGASNMSWSVKVHGKAHK